VISEEKGDFLPRRKKKKENSTEKLTLAWHRSQTKKKFHAVGKEEKLLEEERKGGAQGIVRVQDQRGRRKGRKRIASVSKRRRVNDKKRA